MGEKKVRVAIIGVGNCAAASSRVSSSTRMSRMIRRFRASCMSISADTTSATSSSPPPSTSTSQRSARTSSEAIFADPNNTFKFCDVPESGVTVVAGHDARRPGQVPHAGDQEGPRTRRPISWGSSRTPRPTSWSTTCRLAARRPPSGTSSRSWRQAAPSSTASRCSSPASPTGRSD